MTRTSALAVGAVAGALIATAVPGNLPVLASVSAVALLVAAAPRSVIAHLPTKFTKRVRITPLAVGGAIVLLRAVGGSLMTAPGTEPDRSAPSGSHHTAVVLSLATPDGGLQRAVVELRPPEPAVTVYVWLPRYPQIAQSDVIAFDGALEQPPDTGDFADYLARTGIEQTSRARTMERVGSDGSPSAALEGVRRAASDLLARVLPEPQAGLATAMAIGLRDVVSREVTSDFRDSGLSHVVAISGWHIAMLGAVVAALLGGIPRRPRSVLVVLAIVGYSLLAGAAPSILRAAVMACAVIVARESGRRGQAAAALSLTCLAMLVVDPATISDVGFQLSVVATAGLLAWASPLNAWLGARLPQRTPKWLLEALAVSLAAQASTLPLVLLEFSRLSLVAPLANLLIAPLVAPAMLVTAVCFAFGAAASAGLPQIVVAPIGLAGSLVVGAMIAIAHFCTSLPLANIELPAPFNSVASAAAALLIGLVGVRRASPRKQPQQTLKATRPSNPKRFAVRRSRLIVGGGAVVLSALLAVVALARPDGRLHVSVLDVGQGDSILLQGPNGGRVLIDTGPDPDRLMTLLDGRVPTWDRRLDLVVLTHPHEDHVGGLALLLQRYEVGDIVEPGMIGPGPGDAAYRRELATLGRTSRVVAAGDTLWLDGIELDVDWPLRGTVPLHPADGGTAINNVSIVLELHFGERRMLFTGDVEQQIDPQLLAEGIAAHIGGQLDVLKVAHHGSGTATTDAFVEQMNPHVAVISAGWGNPYGHPAPKTVARLKDHGAQLFRTDLDGNVDISTNGADLVAFAEGGRPHPVQRTPPPPPGVGFCPVYPETAGRRRRQTYNRRHARPVSRRSRRDRAQSSPERSAAAPFDGRRGGRFVHLRGHDPPRCRD